MRSFPIMRKFGYPVVFDVTHSVQLPGGEGKSSGGQPEFIEPLARAGAAVGVDGIFLEVHDNPAKALSDGTNALPLSQFRPLIENIRLAALAREFDARKSCRREAALGSATMSSAKSIGGVKSEDVAQRTLKKNRRRRSRKKCRSRRQQLRPCRAFTSAPRIEPALAASTRASSRPSNCCYACEGRILLPAWGNPA